MKQTTLSADWQSWVEENRARNCDLDEMVEILKQNGFSSETAMSAVYKQQDKANSSPYIPTSQTEFNQDAEVYSIENFLDPNECMKLIELIRDYQRPSTTTNDQGKFKDYRTSQTCDLSLIDSPFVKEIDRRICKMLGISDSYSEGIQGQWYNIGEEFKEHTDYFEPNSKEYSEYASEQGQRTWTFMIYLNTTQSGGETHFPKLNRSFSPKQGKAVIWNNLNPDGSPNSFTLHHGMPVKEGYKAIITKWFRIKGEGDSCNREQNENIRCHTQTGFLKSTIPSALFHQILMFHANNKEQLKAESVPGFIHSETGQASAVLELPEELRKQIHSDLQPIAESWSGSLLIPSYVYGIREYYRGAILEPHRDRLQTHEVSLILNIHQKVDSDWPLVIEDHHYRQHHIYLKPGQMILYEGCRLLHGRPRPFEGDFFANIFVHYSLNAEKRRK
ncbi:prolyl hydroxylase family protein [Neptuniibacter sp. QD34_54]|uniref:prolyl hydroxylase family protein n=1 Tax=Neptuniibacter sp. QD34_54 TaxID=3398208 RepID=UPI0039F526C1